MERETSDGVRLGNISGGIHESVIAGRDITNATVTFGGKTMSAGDNPTPADLAALLDELTTTLSALAERSDILSQISTSAPHTMAGARETVCTAAAHLEGAVTQEKAKSAQGELSEATTLTSAILKRATAMVEGASDAGQAVQYVVATLEPLLSMLAVATLWIGRLWLGA
jgi:hypothetical protein